MWSVKRCEAVVFLCLCCVSSIFAAETRRPLKVCVDSGNWRPFVYQEDGQVLGLHIDTISQALDKMEVKYQYIPSPWKRCLKGAEKGVFDAIATASFNKERAQYLFYPIDAQEQISPSRVGQVQYNIIVHQTSDFQYEDELVSIPQPARVSRDYSIGKDLRSMGFEIDDSSINDLQNLKRLVREKNGSVVALPTLVDWANKQAEYAGKIRLIEKPLKSKSYFLVFSKKGKVSVEKAKVIWLHVREAREKNQYNVYAPKIKVTDDNG